MSRKVCKNSSRVDKSRVDVVVPMSRQLTDVIHRHTHTTWIRKQCRLQRLVCYVAEASVLHTHTSVRATPVRRTRLHCSPPAADGSYPRCVSAGASRYVRSPCDCSCSPSSSTSSSHSASTGGSSPPARSNTPQPSWRGRNQSKSRRR